MINNAICPSCNKKITSVYIEQHGPGYLKGGSQSFVSVALPCGHAIGAVPVSWEVKLDNIQNNVSKHSNDIQNLIYQLIDLKNTLNQIMNMLRNR